MGEINKALGASGSGVRLELGGKTWTLAAATKRRQAEFEAWLEARARREAALFAAELPAEAGRDLVHKTRDEIATGYWTFGGEVCDAALSTPAGVQAFIMILLWPAHPDVTEDDVMTLIVHHAPELLAAVREALSAGPMNPLPAAAP